MPTQSRALAADILLRLEARRAPTLAEQIASTACAALSARDRAFLHEILLGTLRHRAAIDFALAPYLSRPIDRLDAATRTILRLGGFQLLHSRVPARAAVSESVELIKQKTPRSAGLVNAVLRRLAREGPPAFPDPVGAPLDWLTTAGSIPRWLAVRWIARWGAEAAINRARALNQAPPTVIRMNPHVPNAETLVREAGLRIEAAPLSGAWTVTSGRSFDLAARNVIYVQDLGSQIVAGLASGPGRRLDACAAPGGKTTLMADLAGEDGLVVATEINPRRLLQLARTVSEWGCRNVRCVGADGLRPPFRASFDAVLLDAPCSGLGTLGRHPDIRWRARLTDIARHAHRQLELLCALGAVVRPGGLLVYAVCSAEPEEGEDVIQALLTRQSCFATEAPPPWAAPFSAAGRIQTAPERIGGNAFFAVRLRKAGD